MITKREQQEQIIELNSVIANERKISAIHSRLVTELEAQIQNYKEYIVILKQEKAA